MILLILILFVVGTKASFGPNTVNLELETSILLEPSDLSKSKQSIVFRNAQNVIEKLQDAFQLRSVDFDMKPDVHDDEILVEFAKNLGSVLQAYDGDSLKNLVQILNLELQRSQNQPFLASLNPSLRDFVLKNLDKWALYEPGELVMRYQKIIDHVQTPNDSLRMFSIYFTRHDTKNLQRILQELRKNSKNRRDLMKTVRNALNFLVFKRYDNMAAENKMALAKKLDKMAALLVKYRNAAVLLNELKGIFEESLRKSNNKHTLEPNLSGVFKKNRDLLKTRRILKEI